MRTATTKVRRETYERFRKMCQDQQTTPYAVLKDFLMAFVEHYSGGGERPGTGSAAPPVASLSDGSSIRRPHGTAPLR